MSRVATRGAVNSLSLASSGPASRPWRRTASPRRRRARGRAPRRAAPRRAGPRPCDTSGTTEYLPTIPARTCGRARGRSRARSGPKTNHDRPGRTGPASASRKPRGCAPSTRRCRRRACRAAGRSPCGRGASPRPFLIDTFVCAQDAAPTEGGVSTQLTLAGAQRTG